MKKVSVFIPVFNAEPFLAATIESVIHQTFTNWELVIVDDCSTDKSYEIALAYAKANQQITVIRNEENLGMLNNWNKGIGLCKSEYFVKLDADDIWHPGMLEKAEHILNQNPAVGLVFSNFVKIDQNGKEIEGSVLPLPEFAKNKAFSCIPLVKEGPDKMLSYNILKQGLSVMRRNIFDHIGKYKFLLTPETQAATDTEFYYRLGCHYKIYCIDEVLYQYRVHESSISYMDQQRALGQKKLFEIKHCIINYYAEKNVITKDQARKFLKRIKYDYNLFLTAYLRQRGHFIKMSAVLIANLINHPKRVLQFYLEKLLKLTITLR